MTAKNTSLIRTLLVIIMRSRLMVTVVLPSLILLGLGTWLSLVTTLNYFKTFDIANNQEAWSWRLDEKGDYVLSYCPNDENCTSYGELERQFMNFFAIGAILIAVGAALLIMYSKRKYLKAEHII